MEIRMRSAVSRTAKGYSVEATLDMGDTTLQATLEGIPYLNTETAYPAAKIIDALSVFQIAKLKEHMAALGTAFPREEGEKP